MPVASVKKAVRNRRTRGAPPPGRRAGRRARTRAGRARCCACSPPRHDLAGGQRHDEVRAEEGELHEHDVRVVQREDRLQVRDQDVVEAREEAPHEEDDRCDGQGRAVGRFAGGHALHILRALSRFPSVETAELAISHANTPPSRLCLRGRRHMGRLLRPGVLSLLHAQTAAPASAGERAYASVDPFIGTARRRSHLSGRDRAVRHGAAEPRHADRGLPQELSVGGWLPLRRSRRSSASRRRTSRGPATPTSAIPASCRSPAR